MTGSYAFISIIALICYLFLFLTFIAAKRTRIINEFMLILITMILWTGGSFLMRAQLFHSVKAWYDVSILGLTLCPYVSLLFAVDFANIEIGIWRRIWLILAVAANAFNILTGALLAAPEAVLAADGSVAFLYETTWRVIFLYGVTFGASVHMFFLLWKHGKKDEMLKRQMMPIELGLLIMYAGKEAQNLELQKNYNRMNKDNRQEKLTFSTVLKSILSGDILLLLRVDRLLPYILFLFALGWINIFLNYMIEQTMVKVETNKVLLENYKIHHAQKTYEFVKLGRISTVEEMLEKAGSEVSSPEKPAETILAD